jgi:hypothetical protein
MPKNESAVRGSQHAPRTVSTVFWGLQVQMDVCRCVWLVLAWVEDGHYPSSLAVLDGSVLLVWWHRARHVCTGLTGL